MEEIRANIESRKEDNKAIERDAENLLLSLQAELRRKANHSEYAMECWEYYRDNYTGKRFKNAVFSCNYLRQVLATIAY